MKIPKTLPLLAFFAGIFVLATALREKPAAGKPRYFVITYTTGPAWDKNREAQDQPYFNEHSAFMKRLKADKKSRLGARYGDKGMVIIEATDEAEAKQILAGDASVTNGTFTAQVDEFLVFQPGCVE